MKHIEQKNIKMSKINTRSPYFINITTPNVTSAVLELYIYTGTQVATMDSVTYSLESDAYNGYVSFEVSQLISDYLDVTYGGVSTSQVAWVNYQVTETINDVVQTPSTIVQTIAFDGYGYFEDEANPQLSDKLLQSNDKIIILDNNSFYIPVQQDNLNYIDLMYQGEEIGKVVTEGGQNLILYSEQADNAVWTLVSSTITPDAIVSGSYFGDKLGTGIQNAPHLIYQDYTTLGTSQTFTSSFYIKADEYSRVIIWLSDGLTGGLGSDASVHFNTVTKVFSQELTLNDYQILGYDYTDEGDGWFRVSLTIIANTETSLTAIFGVVNDSDSYTFTGDNGGLYVRGMQLQEGALGTYVETTTVGVDNIGGTTYPNRISFTPTTDSGDVIRYVSYTNPSTCAGSTNYLFEDRANYLFEDSNVYVFDNTTMVDEVLITYLDASTQSVSVKTIRESKQTPYRITFINKFGALQSVWMFKRSDLTLNVESEKYRSYTMSNGSYKTSEHQYRSINVSGKESVTLNSGFYPESYNKIFKEIVLSNKVWIDYEGNLLPVNLKSKELAFKTRLNDKLINYQLEFEFAFDTINNVF